jgi:ADP-heptose:LPS heptosyltransferase
MKQPENILIVRTDRIGDVILTLPMAPVLKKHFPGCRVTFLLREYTKELALNNPYIDEILVLYEKEGKPAFFKNLDMIRGKNFDTVITVFPRFRIALFLFYAGIASRIGSGYRWYSFLFNKKVYEHRKFGENHELIHNINLLKTLGINESVTEKECNFGFHPSEENRIKIKRFAEENGIDLSKPVVVFHPASGGSAVDLPMEKMKELVNMTADKLDVTILLTGDKKEIEICSSFPKGEKIFNLCGKFDLGGLIALIDFSSLMVANSTGPLHIAAALGKNVIGFYPKIKSQSPVRWGPFTEKKHIFVPAVNCSNCTRKQCAELNCMNSISVDEVFKAIDNYVNSSTENK